MLYNIAELITQVFQTAVRITYFKYSLRSLWRNLTGRQAGLVSLVTMARVAPPVPIPNTEVKPLSADGTAS